MLYMDILAFLNSQTIIINKKILLFEVYFFKVTFMSLLKFLLNTLFRMGFHTEMAMGCLVNCSSVISDILKLK